MNKGSSNIEKDCCLNDTNTVSCNKIIFHKLGNLNDFDNNTTGVYFTHPTTHLGLLTIGQIIKKWSILFL